VSETPERPFVPRRTPTSSRQLESAAEFRLARPFVPGSARHDTFAGATAATQSYDEYATDLRDNGDELPPIEHFLDPLPVVDVFAPDVEGALADASSDEFGSSAAGSAESGWVDDAWQQYDWRAAAALGDGPETEASTEWATTDWDTGAPVARRQRPNAADAIASALDQIARQIREGELAIPSPASVADSKTIAATLAALLGVRR
jgi:hypothetical protein